MDGKKTRKKSHHQQIPNSGYLKEDESKKDHLENNMDWHGVLSLIFVGLSILI